MAARRVVTTWMALQIASVEHHRQLLAQMLARSAVAHETRNKLTSAMPV